MDKAELDKLQDEVRGDATDSRGTLFHTLKFILIVGLSLSVLSLLTKPLRNVWAENYVDQGDAYLLQNKFIKADLEYQKALTLDGKNSQAKKHQDLAIKAASDAKQWETFFIEKNLSKRLDLLHTASAIPTDESEAVKLSKSLIEKGDYQLAIIPAETATEMDENYRDAWLYLGIANLKTAQYFELKPELSDDYLQAGKTALEHARTLDPEYQATKDYLAAAQAVK